MSNRKKDGGRRRERERQRQTDRQTYRQTENERGLEIDGEKRVGFGGNGERQTQTVDRAINN